LGKVCRDRARSPPEHGAGSTHSSRMAGGVKFCSRLAAPPRHVQAVETNQGIPSYTFQKAPGEPWRSRYDDDKNLVVINNGHRDFAFASRGTRVSVTVTSASAEHSVSPCFAKTRTFS